MPGPGLRASGPLPRQSRPGMSSEKPDERTMTTNEGFEIFSKMLTRTRELQLEKLKRDNSVLRAQIALIEFWKISRAKYALKDGIIVIS